MTWKHALLAIAVLALCTTPSTHAGTLTPRAYLPLILKGVGTFVSPISTPFVSPIPTPTPALSPMSYLPIIMKCSPNTKDYVPPVGPTPTPTPVPIEFTIALTFENNTGGSICYGVEGVKSAEDCVEQDGRVFYGSFPMGNYNFWGRGCSEGSQIRGNADFLYRSATIAFACVKFEGDPSLIWAKMYEMNRG